MRRAIWVGTLAAALVGCGGDAKTAATPKQAPAPARKSPPGAAPVSAKPEERSSLSELYKEELARRPELSFAELQAEIGLRRAADRRLSFDPTTALHFDVVASQLQLTPKERTVFRERGFVSVDHAQRYSMASIYYAVYARDLPVLVTTDSVLHALHRSFDEILKDLEQGLFTHIIGRVLEATQLEAKKLLASAPPPELATALADVDLYLTVARNLLAGAGSSPTDTSSRWAAQDKWDGALVVPSVTGGDAAALAVLRRAAALKLEVPEPMPECCTPIYGGVRPVDWSQLRPRGHYDDSLALRRYFRTLMWLGRVDLGFNLTEPAAVAGLRLDVTRERRAAATLALLLRQSGELSRLQAMKRVIDFLVGRGDDVSVGEMITLLDRAGADLSKLADPATTEKFTAELASATKQQIRSQTVGSSPGGTVETLPPVVFQVFGQRFLVDSYVLSRVVFDSIVYGGEKQKRMLPRGLDVMAALGNDEAIALLQPDLQEFKYGANLLASRRAIERYGKGNFDESAYGMWLDSLRVLDDPLPPAATAPEVMRTQAWQRKMLQTQHASWSELRHDTLLYGKKSYTAFPVCGYPDGYVEPYPALYEKLEALARRMERDLGAADLSHPDTVIANAMEATRKRQLAFLARFSTVMSELARLAKKTLDGKAFSGEELAFLKKTIDMRGAGSGPPRYDGWYPDLFYDRRPESWKPTVADVHTDPESRQALETAVGDASFLVLAVDAKACGGRQHSVYVGPAYTYYEFRQPVTSRLTDQEWQDRISKGTLPQRPEWVAPFVAPSKARHLAAPPPR